MSVTHTVLFQFKATASPDDVKAVGTRSVPPIGEGAYERVARHARVSSH
jgi:hypothetical protein